MPRYFFQVIDDTLLAVAEDPSVGLIILPFAIDYGPVTGGTARRFASIQERTGTPIVPIWMSERQGEGYRVFESARIETKATHGTGCTLASAIAAYIAQGLAIEAAVEKARAYLLEAIAHAPGFGAGHQPLGHGWPMKSS